MWDVFRVKINKFFLGAKKTNYRVGEIIVRADENPQYTYYIKSGFVRIYLLDKNGQELTLYVMGPGLIFSMVWALANIPNRYFFEALTPTETLCMSNEAFSDFVEKDHQLLMELMKINLYGMDGMVARMGSLMFGQASHRTAAAILFAYQYFNATRDYKDLINNLPVTHKIIASFAGLTRETTSVEMKKMERKKIICYRRNVLVINNFEALEKESAD